MSPRWWRAITGAWKAERDGWHTARRIIAEEEAAGWAKPPVPGVTAGPQPSHVAPPAPGPFHPVHGVKLLTADFYEDGTVLVHDHLHRKTTKFEAPGPGDGIDWDTELRGLAND